MNHQQTEILTACRDIGLLVDALEIDNRWHRVPVAGKKRSNRSGAYCLQELVLKSGEVVVVGVAHNWTTDTQQVFDLRSLITPMSEEDKAEARRAIDEAEKAGRAERKKLAEETAARALKIWNGLPVEGQSEYLARKKVRGYGLRYTRGSIVVPARSVSGKLWGLQFIKPDGSKKFLTGTAKQGRFHLIGQIVEGVKLLVVEGYATGATLHQALAPWPVAVAFDAGNLKPVARALRKQYPHIPIIVCADNDRKTICSNPRCKKSVSLTDECCPHCSTLLHVGTVRGREAAQAVGGVCVWPEFS